MFGVVKKLQIMVHLLLINVVIPANASIFFSSLLSLVNFNLIPVEKPTRKILDLNYDQPYSDNFNQLGYDSTYFLINMGTLLYIFFGYLLALLFLAVTANVYNQRF